MDITILIIGLIVGAIAGYFIGKTKAYKSSDLSSQTGAITGLTTQLAEIKGKFDAVEKAREQIDQAKEKRDEEKEKRFKEFIENNQKLFKELKEGNDKSDVEKDKRIKELVENNRKFFDEQQKTTEEFLKAQGKTREDIEKQRDAQVSDMKNMITKFTQTISGTKKRGNVGESILGDILKNSIKAGLVVKELKIGSSNVEFAWDLGDGKFIPIDSKLPDVFELYDNYLKNEDEEVRFTLKKKIKDKIKKNIKEIQKYQNQTNTIDNCILVIPPSILEVCPEVISDGKNANVFVCSYNEVFPIAHILQDQYARMNEEGDVGVYKKMVEQLFNILDKIMNKTESIDRALVAITNSNNTIKTEVGKGKRV